MILLRKAVPLFNYPSAIHLEIKKNFIERLNMEQPDKLTLPVKHYLCGHGCKKEKE